MTVHNDTDTVLAAGCVLWRSSRTGDDIELALVYRPKWGDWSFPKGKAKQGEALPDTAVREVLEETGATCVLGVPLPESRYLDARGRPKEVHYWAAQATGGTFTPNSEVTRLQWLPPAQAFGLLTHSRDRMLLTAFLDTRHAVGRTP
ncbi:NUDIX hydrolase [Streptomyces sp. VRA16 Mangrove soil]|uniref:NUDIX hydrolase n=1 Tax=Streptomyces sp. VRA16 Mangrove soil TaxID=2817434 RepID=UPI001A9F17E6|nr:NUDIX hydrolase [Streptomyces sp. VRA16 Mangrove soil]MBO1337528.1 NUDIX hydrolase [Streptomyces sp. VRA16 Mangrove soil]